MYVWFDALTNYLSGVHALVNRCLGISCRIENHVVPVGSVLSRIPFGIAGGYLLGFFILILLAHQDMGKTEPNH